MIRDFVYNTPHISFRFLVIFQYSCSAVQSFQKEPEMANSNSFQSNADEEEPFLFQIKDFSCGSTKGILVSGCLEKGSLKVGDVCEVIGATNYKIVKSKVTYIELNYKPMKNVLLNEYMSIFLWGVREVDLEKGFVVCAPGTIKAIDHFEGELSTLKPEEGGLSDPIPSNNYFDVHCRSVVAPAHVRFLYDHTMTPGETTGVEIKTSKPVCLRRYERFVLKCEDVIVGTVMTTRILPHLSDRERIMLARSIEKSKN